ncbi:MAG: ROK family transcriptional regulator [Paludibacteraceae bacterium]|nr:ROK family transcriptional regulator [Paludibacteraceae bacterium]
MKQSFVDEIRSGSKGASLKIEIIRYYILNGNNTIAELSKELNLSVPTVTKLVAELMEDGFVADFGKQETAGGRRPNMYGVKPESGYFMGVDIRDFGVNIALINFNGVIVASNKEIPYKQQNSPESLDVLCDIINNFMHKLSIPKEKILNVGINATGLVTTDSGHKYSRYFFNEQPLSEIFKQKLGLYVTIDNDSRAMAYGEYMCGAGNNERNVIFVDVSWGLGMGIINNGKLYYGKSGYAGEFGHMSVFDNEVMCHCGKKGCLETQASGSYIYRRLIDEIAKGNSSVLQKKIAKGETLLLDDIIKATLKGDMLAIELVEEVGNTLGKHIAGLINLLNPELVIIGGTVAQTGDYLLFPIKSAIRKYSLNLVGNDTAVKLSKLGDTAGVVGACMLARSKMLSLI